MPPFWHLAGLALPVLILAGCRKDDNAGGLDPVTPGSLALSVSGLPAGASAAVTLSGPGGFSRAVVRSDTINGLAPGDYQVTADSTSADGDGYSAAEPTQTIRVQEGPAITAAATAYRIVTGRLVLSVAGAPPGAGEVLVRGPNGFAHIAVSSETLKGLVPGTYTVRPLPVTVDGDRFAADSLGVSVTPGTTGASANVTYRLATGRLALTISDVPSGATPTVTLSGPRGYSAAVSAGEVFKGLEPGVYGIAVAPIASGGHQYQPVVTPDDSIMVAAVPIPASAAVGFVLATGTLEVAVAGLPLGASGNVTVTGPGSFLQQIGTTRSWTGIAPGNYLIAAANVVAGGTTFVPTPVSQNAAVQASTTPLVRTVQYSLGVGSLAISVAGLPSGVASAVTVTGPNSFVQAVTASQTLTGLAPGTYTIAAAPVTTGGQSYQPTPSSQSKPVTVGATAAAAVTYGVATGGLALAIAGLPPGVPALVAVTGPGGFSQSLTASQSLTSLTPGTYTITAADVASGGTTYLAFPSSQTAPVTAGAITARSVTYTGGGGGPTVVAASCSRSDVQAAVDSVADGYTVVVPVGTCTWGSPVRPHNAKGVTLRCATVAGCIITATTQAVLLDALSGINTHLYRVTGFRFQNSGAAFLIWFDGNGTMTNVRVDHNIFALAAGSVAVFFGDTQGIANYYGVVDHNTLLGSGNVALLQIIGDTNPAPPPSQLGTANNMFVEDNTIAITTMTNAGFGCMDSWGNGAIVWRFNTTLNCLVTSHGVTHSGGPQNLELYGNALRVDAGSIGAGVADGYRLFHHQGSGEFIAFNNLFTAHSGKNGDPLEMTHYRSAPPSTAGYSTALGRCDGTDPKDGNRAPTSTYFGYPCWRQPGRDFAGNLRPMYVWNNKWSDTGGKIDMLVATPWGTVNPSVEDHIKPDRDYYNAVGGAQTAPSSPFNGTTGMGYGSLANRPTTCATNPLESGGGVGYFATDQGPRGTLYQCSATNTWSVWYVPYTYPHPLTAIP